MTATTLAAPTPDAPPQHGGGTPDDDVPGADVPGPESRGVAGRLRARLGAPDAGMATAEYAIATVAAAGFAGLLLLILRSDEVRGMLLGIVRGALQV